MTKILFIGDPHIKTDNGEDVDLLLLEIRRITQEEKYDAIIVGGDVMHYHERLFTQALNKSLHFISTLRDIALTYVMVGNHDAINNSIFLTDQHWMNALKSWDNVVIVDDVVDVGRFVLCPYVPPGRLIEALETKLDKEEWMGRDIIFAHQEIRGCRMGAIISTEGDEWLSTYPLLVSGHIHDHQQIGVNVHYPGTPLQHSFGDSDTRVLTKIEISEMVKKGVVITYLPITVPRKKIVKGTIETISKNIATIKKEMEKGEGKLKLKIKIDASTTEFSAFKTTNEYRELMSYGVRFQLQPRLRERGDENGEDNDKNENNENDKNTENNDKNKSFKDVLEEMMGEDEPLVKSLYDEIILEKIVLPFEL